MVVHLKHIRIQMIHKMHGQFTVYSRIKGRHDVHLLDLVRICLGPCIVLPCRIIRRIYFCIHVFQFFRIVCSVAVTDRISPPSLK